MEILATLMFYQIKNLGGTQMKNQKFHFRTLTLTLKKEKSITSLALNTKFLHLIRNRLIIRYYNQILTNAIRSEKPGEVMASHDNFIIFEEELMNCCRNSFYSSCNSLKLLK